MVLFGLASKLGLHPVTLAHLADIFTSFPKVGTSRGPIYSNEGTSLQ
jgi:hypothetical protein